MPLAEEGHMIEASQGLRVGRSSPGSSLTEQRERLRSILEGVESAARELADHLEPVLTPHGDVKDGALRELAPSESPFAAEVRERADQADRLQHLLRDLVARLEIE